MIRTISPFTCVRRRPLPFKMDGREIRVDDLKPHRFLKMNRKHRLESLAAAGAFVFFKNGDAFVRVAGRRQENVDGLRDVVRMGTGGTTDDKSGRSTPEVFSREAKFAAPAQDGFGTLKLTTLEANDSRKLTT